MFPHLFIQDSMGAITNAVQLPVIDLANVGDPEYSPIYSGIRFHSDGMIYRHNAFGGFQPVAAWLLRGTNSTFYISRTIDSGTLAVDDGTIVQMNTGNIDYSINQVTPGKAKLATVSFKIYDNGTETGAPLATRTYSLDAFMNPA